MNNKEENISLTDFKASIKKVKEHRKYKVTNSIGVYDGYKWIRKNKWLNIGRPLTEHEFYSIIRKVNKYLILNFLDGYDIKFPYNMGKLELIKYDTVFKIVNGKLKTNLGVDWDTTLKLWYEDKEAYKNKTLIKSNRKNLYKIIYIKSKSTYINKCFYDFKVNRVLKQLVSKKISENNLDACIIKK